MLKKLNEFARLCALRRTREHDLMLAALRARSYLRALTQPTETLARALRARPQLSSQLRFQAFPEWPADVADTLCRLPYAFVRPGAIAPETAAWAFAQVLEQRPRLLVELGAGVSTVVLALAVERLSDPLGRPSFVCLERAGDSSSLREALTRTGLLADVDLRDLSGLQSSADVAHLAELIGDLSQIDLLFVGTEGFSAEFIGALHPRLAPDARVVIDGAGLPPQRDGLREWRARGQFRVLDFFALGSGVALLCKA